MSKQIKYGTLFACAVACSAVLFAHPVQAAANSSETETAAQVQAKINVPVMFSKETYVRSMDDVYTALDKKVEKYAKGTLIGSGLNGEAEVEINGTVYYAEAGSFVYAPADVENLENQKKAEEEAKKKAEEEAKKAEEEKKRQEEEAKKAAEEEAARQEALKKQQEEAEAARKAAEEKAAQEKAAAAAQSAAQPAAAVSYSYSGSVLTPSAGVNYGPSGKETYYNLDMSGVISIMRSMGNTDEYWVRADGVKMLGNYVMVAANLNVRPRGSLVQTSLGMGIVCDTGGFAAGDSTQLDIATAW